MINAIQLFNAGTDKNKDTGSGTFEKEAAWYNKKISSTLKPESNPVAKNLIKSLL